MPLPDSASPRLSRSGCQLARGTSVLAHNLARFLLPGMTPKLGNAAIDAGPISPRCESASGKQAKEYLEVPHRVSPEGFAEQSALQRERSSDEEGFRLPDDSVFVKLM